MARWVAGGGSSGVTIDNLPTSGIISAHRGSSREQRPMAPENSLSAYRAAAALGCHIIDVDNQTTGDGVPVAMHDTTVDATTAGAGLVSAFAAHQMPDVHMPEVVGQGWPSERVPSVREVLTALGGRVLLTLEPKGGTPGVAPLAAIIREMGLTRSVYINTPSAVTAQAITDAGCMPHVYGVTTTAGVDAAAAAGAKLIEVPHNASTALVNHALASGIHRVIAAPIWTFAQLAAMTPGIQGYVNDAVGYLGRPGGAGVRSASSLSGSVSSARRGAGWYRFGTNAGTNTSWLTTAGVSARDVAESAGARNYMFGDLSGDPATSGTITYRFSMPTLPTDTFNRIGLRVLCPEEGTVGADGDTKGYVISLRANGQLNMWSSPAGAYGGGTALGATPTTTALVAGTTYELVFEWNATQVKLTRTDTAATTGWVNDTLWRGRYIYTVSTVTTGQTLHKDVIVS